MDRIIMLVDLDYFYAQVEEREHTEYKGKPLVVCVYSGRSRDSGAVATCNYEARKLGIKAGMPISFAKKAADNETIFVPVRIDHYREVSARIMEIMKAFADKFEQVSVDEAYLDVSQRARDFEGAIRLAEIMKKEIREKENLTCSVGIGPNKLIAKMAASVNKPDGLTIIKPEKVKQFLEPLKVSKLHGIGPKIESVLREHGINTIKDLASIDVKQLQQLFGSNKGLMLHERANGIDNEEVEDSEKQQISRIKTLKEDSRDPVLISEILSIISDEVHEKVKERGVRFKTVSIIAINPSIELKTRSHSLANSTDRKEVIEERANALLRQFLSEHPTEHIRRIGIRVSNFSESQNRNTLEQFFK